MYITKSVVPCSGYALLKRFRKIYEPLRRDCITLQAKKFAFNQGVSKRKICEQRTGLDT